METSISYKQGDKRGIAFNTMTYALKDLVVKMYDEIQILKNKIKVLEG
jgi:hypothetical protein